MLEACGQQERLLDACLALGRSQAGLEGCAIVDIASLTAALLRTVDLEGLSVTVRLEPALTTGVATLIEQLLDNLVSNAVRHNRAGGWITLGAGCTRTQALFTIENTGRRIPVDEVARLFEPFQQLLPRKQPARPGAWDSGLRSRRRSPTRTGRGSAPRRGRAAVSGSRSHSNWRHRRATVSAYRRSVAVCPPPGVKLQRRLWLALCAMSPWRDTGL